MSEEKNTFSLSIGGETKTIAIPKKDMWFAENLIAAGRHAARCKPCDNKMQQFFAEIIAHSKRDAL